MKDFDALYFVGAGGIGMAALERYFLAKGKFVAGYDRTPSDLTKALENEGVHIDFDEDPALIPNECRDPQRTLVVYTPAVPDTHKGLTYFRESDKQLTGTITYTYTDNGVKKDNQEATFSMADPGDFLRNHSWIIYIYYMDSKIYTLTVTNIGMRKWEEDPLDETKDVYNW